MSSVAPFTSSVQFYGDIKALTLGPNTLRIVQEEFKHDYAVMDFWGGDISSDALNSGMPMLITWGRSGTQRSFYGYVNQPKGNRSRLKGGSLVDHNSTIVYCVGASWPLQQTDSKSWSNVTAPQVAQQIAKQFKLDSLVGPDKTLWPNLQMSGRSYFDFLCNLAKRIGYVFYVNGVQLTFVPRQTNPKQLKSVAAIYDYNADPGAIPKFSPTLGANSTSGGQLRNRKIAGVNLRTSQPISATVSGNPAPTILGQTADTAIFDHTEHAVVTSQAEATSKLNGSALLNQLYASAKATLIGNPFIAQGSIVFIKNVNGSQNGLWFVQRAEHTLDRNTYSIDADLGRDSTGAAPTIAFTISTANLPKASLSNGLWVAS